MQPGDILRAVSAYKEVITGAPMWRQMMSYTPVGTPQLKRLLFRCDDASYYDVRNAIASHRAGDGGNLSSGSGECFGGPRGAWTFGGLGSPGGGAGRKFRDGRLCEDASALGGPRGSAGFGAFGAGRARRAAGAATTGAGATTTSAGRRSRETRFIRRSRGPVTAASGSSSSEYR